MSSAPKKTVALISGANTGIGLEVATQLAKTHGFHVIIGSRHVQAGRDAASALTKDGHAASSVQLDLTSDESIAAAASTIESEFGVLDVLINNAGILIDHVEGITDAYKGLTTRELFRQTFDTNVFGTACLTEAVLPLIRKSDFARIVFVSSIMGSLQESTNQENSWYSIDYKSYDASKAAFNMLALNYARILDGTGALVNVVCPGLVQTKLTNFHPYGTTVELGAQRIVQLATAGKDGETRTFSNRDGKIAW